MPLEFCILASGSSGNASVMRCAGGVMLVDCGIGPRTTARRLDGTGVRITDIRSIVLTHLDSDHFNPRWLATLLKLNITVYCHESRREDLLACTGFDRRVNGLVRCFDDQPFGPLDGLDVRAIRLAHDEHGSHGFVIRTAGGRTLGYASDLGQVPGHLLEEFEDVDVVALESNYDPQMEISSNRPWFLKQRIMGGRGHLSNEQALAAIRSILDRRLARRRDLPQHIVLLHRSRQCNCPKLLHKLFSADERIAPRLVLTDQYERTCWLRATASPPLAGEQLALAW